MVKVQLIVIIPANADISEWQYQLDTNFLEEKYSAVDVICYSGQEQMLKNFSSLLNRSKFFLHCCYSTLEDSLNYLIRNDCDYYVLCTNPKSVANLMLLPARLTEKHAVLIKPDDEILNNTVVYTKISKELLHWGRQSIIEKISIHAINHGREDVVYENMEEYLNG